MTRTTKLLLASGALALGATAFAGASLADGGWGGREGHARWGGFGPGFFEMFDVNGDGRLTQAEIDQVRQQRLAKFDTNGDGKLSLEEYQALWMDAMHVRMVRAFQAHDADGDGLVTVEEFTAPYSHVVSRLDTNGDGQLTQDELRHRQRDHEGEGGRGGHEGRGGWGGFGPSFFEAFDVNGDGKVTQAEIDQVRQQRLAKFDTNGDGKLSLEEYQALWMDAMHVRMVRAFQALDSNGDGLVTVEEFTAPYSHVVNRLDTNGDGQLTQDEVRHRQRDRGGDDGPGRDRGD
jgi:Ca2+-binding EF-hand superfamily protein